MIPNGPGASSNSLNPNNPGYWVAFEALSAGARQVIPEKELTEIAQKHYDNPEVIAREIANYDDGYDD